MRHRILKHIGFWLVTLALFAAGIAGIMWLAAEFTSDGESFAIFGFVGGLVWGLVFGKLAAYAWLAVFE